MTRSLRVALLQLPAFNLADHERAWTEMLRRIDEAGASRPDLIVLPEASYPAYFLHSREAYEDAGVRPDAEVQAALAEQARRHGCYIAAGLVLRAASGALENACVLFDPEGRRLGHYAKSFLWHFDRSWFAAGNRFPVFDVAGARAGLLVCADGRLPEIARSFAVAGAQLIIDCTAWVTTGSDRAALTSPQVEYLMRARAIENGTWVVAANKVGVEADSLLYCGRSGVIDPRGEWVVQAPASRAGVVTYTLDLDAAKGPPVARRPELYGGAAVAGERSRAAALAAEPLVPEQAAARVAAVTLDGRTSAAHLVNRARRIVRTLAAQDTRLVVLPDLAQSAERADAAEDGLLPPLRALSAETGVQIVVGLAERHDGRTFRTQYLLSAGEVLAAHRLTHLGESELEAGFSAGDAEPPVVETGAGNVGLLAGCEGLAPEVARSLKLRGADLLAWSAGAISAPLDVMARARANENRAYVIAAGAPLTAGGALVIDPSGSVLAESLTGEQMAVSADVNRALSRWNEMAPGTNPVMDRNVAAFASLFRAPFRTPEDGDG